MTEHLNPAQKAMWTLLHDEYFHHPSDRIFVPDEYRKLDGFDVLLEQWITRSTMCGEPTRDAEKGGTYFCSRDAGHVVAVEHAGAVDEAGISRSLAQEGGQ